MSVDEPRNNLSWRVTVLEREVDRLKEGRPDVVADRVARLERDLEAFRKETHDEFQEIKGEQAAQRKLLIGYLVSTSLIAVGIALTYFLTGGPVH